jgi:hypothetical protein
MTTQSLINQQQETNIFKCDKIVLPVIGKKYLNFSFEIGFYIDNIKCSKMFGTTFGIQIFIGSEFIDHLDPDKQEYLNNYFNQIKNYEFTYKIIKRIILVKNDIHRYSVEIYFTTSCLSESFTIVIFNIHNGRHQRKFSMYINNELVTRGKM